MRKIQLLVLIILLFLNTHLHSYENNPSKTLPTPRYASLKSNKIKMRIGPGRKYKTSNIYECIHHPVKIIAEFDNWRKIEDSNGTQGWVYHSLLSNTKYAMIVNDKHKGTRRLKDKISHHQLLAFKSPEENSSAILKVELGVIAKIHKCKKSWCKISIAKYTGWIKKENLWGV